MSFLSSADYIKNFAYRIINPYISVIMKMPIAVLSLRALMKSVNKIMFAIRLRLPTAVSIALVLKKYSTNSPKLIEGDFSR